MHMKLTFQHNFSMLSKTNQTNTYAQKKYSYFDRNQSNKHILLPDHHIRCYCNQYTQILIVIISCIMGRDGELLDKMIFWY
jgi:hypothetical protein